MQNFHDVEKDIKPKNIPYICHNIHKLSLSKEMTQPYDSTFTRYGLSKSLFSKWKKGNWMAHGHWKAELFQQSPHHAIREELFGVWFCFNDLFENQLWDGKCVIGALDVCNKKGHRYVNKGFCSSANLQAAFSIKNHRKVKICLQILI